MATGPSVVLHRQIGLSLRPIRARGRFTALLRRSLPPHDIDNQTPASDDAR
jgi:hypothetical protein